MHVLRRLSLVSVLAAGTMVGVSTAALAAPAAPSQGSVAVNAARQAAAGAWQAFEARAAARFHPHAAAAATPLARTAPGTAFSKITDIGSASRDTLPSPTGIEPDTQVEPDVAIDPGNPAIITAVFQQGRNGPSGGSADPGYATSQNGGRTWADGNLPMLTTVTGGPFHLASDAAVTFGPDGSAYAQTIPFDQTGARSAVAVQRSTDGGVSFGPPSLVVDDNNVNIFNDKNWIAVDNSARSPHLGRLYSVWSRFVTTGSGPSHVTNSPGAVSFSDDQGKTWSPVRFTTSATADTEGLIPLIHPDGSITVVYDLSVPNAANPKNGNDYETAQTSHDGGLTCGGR